MKRAIRRAMMMSTFSVPPLLLTGCVAPIRSGSSFEPGLNFGEYGSFSWEESEALPTGDPRVDNNPLFQQRVRAAIQWEFATRGIELAREGYDEFEFGRAGRALAVHHRTSVQERVEEGPDSGPSGGDGDEAEALAYPEATFILVFRDAQTRELVWSAWAELDFEAALADPVVMQRQVDAAVAAMFEGFPVSVGRAPQGAQ